MLARIGIKGLLLVGAVSLLSSSEAHAVCTEADKTDCVDRFISYTGTIDFFASGASLSVAEIPNDDRPNRVLELGEVRIPAFRIPDRAELVSAYLYYGGSLFLDNDGNDEFDLEVELRVPGSDEFHFVRADQAYQSGMIPGFSEVSLYSARADITPIMKEVNGPLEGTYQLQKFAADILYNDAPHTVANASFSIVLIFEEPRLSPRTIVLFDGMQEVLGSTVSLPLSGFTVSEVPSGSMTIYALEGDCNPGPGRCADGDNLSGAERIRVSAIKTDDDASCNARQIAESDSFLTLFDATNPQNDIFNRTINTVDPPLRNVPGTDIDQFDITAALNPGDTCVTVETTAPYPTGGQTGELIGLAYVIVGIDVFAPELREDSRIEIRTENGQYFPQYFPGDPLRVSYVVSNTGNLPGTEISLEANLPPQVTGFEILNQPKGSNLVVNKNGGPNGTGSIIVSDISVRHGDSTALELLVQTECPLASLTEFSMTATVSAAKQGGTGVNLEDNSVLIASQRCGARFFLFGDGGCQTGPFGGSKTGFVLFLLGLIGLGICRKKGMRFLTMALICISFGQIACGDTVIAEEPDQPPAEVIGVECPGYPGMIVVPAINDQSVFCIDAFEASAQTDANFGNPDQSMASEAGDGSTLAIAESQRFVQPVRGVSFYQARAACANSGKRLCSATEWITACRGDGDLTYPYGDVYDREKCNGHDSGRKDVVESGAMFEVQKVVGSKDQAAGCVSQHGAYDMSGNLWEWNSTLYLDNTRRGLVGGSFQSNKAGLRCVTDDNYALPLDSDPAYGFRCCLDYPF